MILIFWTRASLNMKDVIKLKKEISVPLLSRAQYQQNLKRKNLICENTQSNFFLSLCSNIIQHTEPLEKHTTQLKLVLFALNTTWRSELQQTTLLIMDPELGCSYWETKNHITLRISYCMVIIFGHTLPYPHPVVDLFRNGCEFIVHVVKKKSCSVWLALQQEQLLEPQGDFIWNNKLTRRKHFFFLICRVSLFINVALLSALCEPALSVSEVVWYCLFIDCIYILY